MAEGNGFFRRGTVLTEDAAQAESPAPAQAAAYAATPPGDGFNAFRQFGAQGPPPVNVLAAGNMRLSDIPVRPLASVTKAASTAAAVEHSLASIRRGHPLLRCATCGKEFDPVEDMGMRRCWVDAYESFRERNVLRDPCATDPLQLLAVARVPADHLPPAYAEEPSAFYDTKGTIPEADFLRLLDLYSGRKRELLEAAATDIHGNRWVSMSGGGRGDADQRGFLEAAVREANDPMSSAHVFLERYDKRLHAAVGTVCENIDHENAGTRRALSGLKMMDELQFAGFRVTHFLPAPYGPDPTYSIVCVASRVDGGKARF